MPQENSILTMKIPSIIPSKIIHLSLSLFYPLNRFVGVASDLLFFLVIIYIYLLGECSLEGSLIIQITNCPLLQLDRKPILPEIR